MTLDKKELATDEIKRSAYLAQVLTSEYAPLADRTDNSRFIRDIVIPHSYDHVTKQYKSDIEYKKAVRWQCPNIREALNSLILAKHADRGALLETLQTAINESAASHDIEAVVIAPLTLEQAGELAAEYKRREEDAVKSKAKKMAPSKGDENAAPHNETGAPAMVSPPAAVEDRKNVRPGDIFASPPRSKQIAVAPRVQLAELEHQARRVDGRLRTTPPQHPEHATLVASLAELRSEMKELRSENKRLRSRTHGAVMSVDQRVALSAARAKALFADSENTTRELFFKNANHTRELFLKKANHTTAVGQKVVGAVFEATSVTDAQLHQVMIEVEEARGQVAGARIAADAAVEHSEAAATASAEAIVAIEAFDHRSGEQVDAVDDQVITTGKDMVQTVSIVGEAIGDIAVQLTELRKKQEREEEGRTEKRMVGFLNSPSKPLRVAGRPTRGASRNAGRSGAAVPRAAPHSAAARPSARPSARSAAARSPAPTRSAWAKAPGRPPVEKLQPGANLHLQPGARNTRSRAAAGKL